MSRLAERQVEPFTVWDPVQLNEFGQAAVADLSDAERVLESYVDSLEELRLYRRALRVQERHPSRLHQLGAIDERFMAEQPPTFDGVREVKLVERTLVPEPESVKRSPFRVEVSPDLERVDEMAVVRDNTLSWTNVTVTRTDASTYVKAFQGPVVTYRLMLDAAIDVNYVSFVSLVPCRLVNVHIWANGGKTTVDVDREIFGQEVIRFDPQDCAEVEIVVKEVTTALLIPRGAVETLESGHRVRRKKGRVFSWHDIEGRVFNDREFLVTKGLSEGDTIALEQPEEKRGTSVPGR